MSPRRCRRAALISVGLVGLASIPGGWAANLRVRSEVSLDIGIEDNIDPIRDPSALEPPGMNSSSLKVKVVSQSQPQAVIKVLNSAKSAVWPAGQPPTANTPPGLQHDTPPTLPGDNSQLAPPPPAQAPVTTVKPQLFFLFLVYVKINNEEVWNRFFSAAVHGIDFRALVHCKSEASCRENILAQHHYEIIPSVETGYCSNLVNGMNALLRAAIDKSAVVGTGSAFDKFVFISDSTLPVKNFHFVQQHLLNDANSNFCVFPRNEWAEITETFPGKAPVTQAAIKHHQWVILSRKHAEMAVQRADWNANFMGRFQLNQGFRNLGCLDEFWYFATLFKTFDLSGNPESFHLLNFGGGEISTTSYEIQGQCDTFVNWHPQASGTNNNITRLAQSLSADPGTELTPLQTWQGRPASIRRFSQAALMTLRNSPFLFVRKVEDGAAFSGCGTLIDGFDNFILSEPPKVMQAQPAWRGQGSWLDNRGSPVVISSVDGSMRLEGTDQSTHARGSYCGDSVDVVWPNGFAAVASLSTDGLRLRWSNGVVWEKTQTGAPGAR